MGEEDHGLHEHATLGASKEAYTSLAEKRTRVASLRTAVELSLSETSPTEPAEVDWKVICFGGSLPVLEDHQPYAICDSNWGT